MDRLWNSSTASCLVTSTIDVLREQRRDPTDSGFRADPRHTPFPFRYGSDAVLGVGLRGAVWASQLVRAAGYALGGGRG